MGGKLISADEIGREVVEKNPPVLSKLIRTFGKEIVNPDGTLKRRELGKMAFASQENRLKLNKIVHPSLLRRLEEEIEKYSQLPDCKMVIIDAALLIDWNLQTRMDFTVCVTAPRKLMIGRLMADGFSEAEAIERIRSQKPSDEMEKASDFVINNDGSLKDLRAKAKEVYNKIQSLWADGK